MKRHKLTTKHIYSQQISSDSIFTAYSQELLKFLTKEVNGKTSMSYLFPPLPLKEFPLLGLEASSESCPEVGDPSLTAQILWLIAEPGLSCADVRVVALRLLGRTQTDVTGGCLGEVA